jgi:hypothetical protein
MEGYDSRRVKDVLKIPDRYDVPLMCCIGYKYEEEGGKNDDGHCHRAPRLEPKEVFFSDCFGNELDLLQDENVECQEESSSC